VVRRLGEEVDVSGETPFADRTFVQLIEDAQNGRAGPMFEAMRRLVIAIERQSRASGLLTGWIIALMAVQILCAVAQIWVTIVKVGR